MSFKALCIVKLLIFAIYVSYYEIPPAEQNTDKSNKNIKNDMSIHNHKTIIIKT